MELSILNLRQSIKILNNVSEKTSDKLAKIGINTIMDLLFYKPINVIRRYECKDIANLKVGQHCIIVLKIIKRVKLKKTIQVLAQDSEGEIIQLNFFNTFARYLDSYLPLQQDVKILGVPSYYNNKLVINHPEKVLKLNSKYKIVEFDVFYRQHQDITSYKFKDYIQQALEILNKCVISEWFDRAFLSKYNLPSFIEALNSLHNPKSTQDISFEGRNITRLAIDEMTSYHLYLLYLRSQTQKTMGLEFKPTNALNKQLLKLLPYDLTTDQIEALKFIKTSFIQPTQSTILLQGDVGSGKTVVSLISALFAIESGYQVAFMAPTAVLATQHYEFIEQLVQKLNLKVALLTGADKKSVKTKIIDSLKNHQIDILVGTHAIFQENIQFAKLGLVIVDEQHRFGVNQRLSLILKGNNPNVLLTTATPIPRTLALALYGDIMFCEIKNKPQSRKETITKLINKNKMEELLTFVKLKLQQKQKFFWICPLVEDVENNEKQSVESTFKKLSQHIDEKYLFCLHGKMKTKQKDEILLNFKNMEEGAILISTTVIEVGINIVSCNNIIIENAENFGLAQLHQLRGRVGRGLEQGLCFLVYDSILSNNAKKKLQEMRNSNDGFYLAQKDLEIRGYGNLMGKQQSGEDIFKIAQLDYHAKYLITTLQYAKLLLQKSREENNDKFKNKVSTLLSLFHNDKASDYRKV